MLGCIEKFLWVQASIVLGIIFSRRWKDSIESPFACGCVAGARLAEQGKEEGLHAG
jgi:hypothetical protein